MSTRFPLSGPRRGAPDAAAKGAITIRVEPFTGQGGHSARRKYGPKGRDDAGPPRRIPERNGFDAVWFAKLVRIVTRAWYAILGLERRAACLGELARCCGRPGRRPGQQADSP